MSKYLVMEFGQDVLRVAEVSKSGSGIVVSKTFASGFPAESVKDGKVHITDELINEVRRSLEENRTTTKDVVFVVNSTRILYKKESMPYVSGKSLSDNVRMCFSEDFPVDDTMYHPSFFVSKIYQDGKVKKADVCKFAVPNDLSDTYFRLAVSLGLNIVALRPSSHALSVPEITGNTGHGTVAIEINDANSTISIVSNGSVISTKTVNFGVSGVVDVLKENNPGNSDLDFVSALRVLASQDIVLRFMPGSSYIPDSKNEQLRCDITRIYGRIISAAGDVITSAMMQDDSLSISEIILAGPGAIPAGVSLLFSHEMGVKTTVVSQLPVFKFGKGCEKDKDLYTTAAASVSDKSNLLTKQEKEGGERVKKEKRDRFILIMAAVLVVGLVGYSVNAVLQATTERSDKESQHKEVSLEVESLEALGVQAVYNTWADAKEYYEKVESLCEASDTGNVRNILAFLNELEEVMPTGAHVVGLNISPTDIYVTFEFDDEEAAALMLHNARNMTTKTTVALPNVVPDDDGTSSGKFEFRIPYDGYEETEPETTAAEEDEDAEDDDEDVEEDEE